MLNAARRGRSERASITVIFLRDGLGVSLCSVLSACDNKHYRGNDYEQQAYPLGCGEGAEYAPYLIAAQELQQEAFDAVCDKIDIERREALALLFCVYEQGDKEEQIESGLDKLRGDNRDVGRKPGYGMGEAYADP